MADEPSRLSSGNIYYQGRYISIADYRNLISARNLYNLNNEYEVTHLFSSNNDSNVANSISSILAVIPQYNYVAVNSQLAGNIYDSFKGDQPSALAKIGLVMLGKQLAFNSANNLATQHLGTLDFSQILKGNIKGIWRKNIDNTITIKNAEDKTVLEKIGGFANKYLGFRTYDVFGDANPFPKQNVSNLEYIKNTGKAQLTRFLTAIDLNIYKPINDNNFTILNKISNEVDDKSIKSKYISAVANNKKFFNFDAASNPYFSRNIYKGIKKWGDSIEIANNSMLTIYNTGITTQEYAPDYQSIVDNFGNTIIKEKRDEELKFNTDNNNNQLVWGRDGVSDGAKGIINDLRGNYDADNDNSETQKYNLSLKPRTGLLEYTRNLLNATEGNFVDITRKVFKDGENILGFQGSPLWRGNITKYSIESGQVGKTGVRQHTILDPYNNFAKSIRYNGNIIYNGSPESVINKTVLPRIHPTNTDDVFDNKNLMFSLENLAVGTIKRDTYGVIDDEYATAIPLSEVGSFGGRMMWFPPYDIQINEVAIAKYESTVMIGRNEPMYNYMNSERTAVLSFTLLVDYPELLRNVDLKVENKNKAIADFFAFGGNPLPRAVDIENWEKQIKDLEKQIPEIEGPTDQAEPTSIKATSVIIHFQNDRPTSDETDTIISTMYNNPNHYEIINGFNSAQDGNGWGLNNKIYYIENITGDSKDNYGLSGGTTSNQYIATERRNKDNSVSFLNENLYNVYSNVENRKYYSITITAEASKLYLISEKEKAYNIALGNRRVQAAKKLVQSRLNAMFPDENPDDIKIICVDSIGSEGQSDAGALADNMHERKIKEERIATIKIQRSVIPPKSKEQILIQKQIDNVAEIQKQINVLQLNIKKAKHKDVLNSNIFNERKDKEDAILYNFESIIDNKFYPIFHSQTPEDFHRRLTFLQQCTRQGAATRYNIKKDEYGTLRAKNSVFGKQPICILRIGDFFYTKVIIDNVTIDYNDTTWDMNPEGFGMQPMIAKVVLQMKLIGGQSLKGPIDALQNAVTFNYYANSNFSNNGIYSRPSEEANKQASYINGIVTEKSNKLIAAYEQTTAYKVREGEE